MTIFCCLRFETPPTCRARSPYLYPQALGSLFMASYDSQGYGAGIRTRLHAELTHSTLHSHFFLQTSRYVARHGPHRKRFFQQSYCCMRVWCGDRVTASEPFPSNGSITQAFSIHASLSTGPHDVTSQKTVISMYIVLFFVDEDQWWPLVNTLVNLRVP
jgi:hypothetical protein